MDTCDYAAPLQTAWGDTPQVRFWKRLLNENVDNLIKDPEKHLLRHMRHNHDMVKDYQRRFGHIFRERGLSLYKLIADACGEIWDDEDEEKGGVMKIRAPINQRINAVSLDNSRQVGVREDQTQGGLVPRRDGASEEDVQEGRLREGSAGISGGSSPEKAPGPKKKS